MNWTDIVVALISLVGAAIGTFYGIHKANNLTVYRIEQLEKKVDEHNRVQERMRVVEQQAVGFTAEIDTLKTATTRQSEQIDNIFEMVEKVQTKLELIEKSIISRVGGN